MKKLLMVFVTAALLAVCLCVPAFAADELTFPCSHLEEMSQSGPGSTIGLCYADSDHYFYCVECSAIMSFASYLGSAMPHSGSDCEACSLFDGQGLGILGVLPSSDVGILPTITALVTASIDWLTAIATCIVSTPLLLCFVLVSFVGLGVGLIKRVIHL